MEKAKAGNADEKHSPFHLRVEGRDKPIANPEGVKVLSESNEENLAVKNNMLLNMILSRLNEVSKTGGRQDQDRVLLPQSSLYDAVGHP